MCCFYLTDRGDRLSEWLSHSHSNLQNSRTLSFLATDTSGVCLGLRPADGQIRLNSLGRLIMIHRSPSSWEAGGQRDKGHFTECKWWHQANECRNLGKQPEQREEMNISVENVENSPAGRHLHFEGVLNSFCILTSRTIMSELRVDVVIRSSSNGKWGPLPDPCTHTPPHHSRRPVKPLDVIGCNV